MKTPSWCPYQSSSAGSSPQFGLEKSENSTEMELQSSPVFVFVLFCFSLKNMQSIVSSFLLAFPLIGWRNQTSFYLRVEIYTSCRAFSRERESHMTPVQPIAFSFPWTLLNCERIGLARTDPDLKDWKSCGGSVISRNCSFGLSCCSVSCLQTPSSASVGAREQACKPANLNRLGQGFCCFLCLVLFSEIRSYCIDQAGLVLLISCPLHVIYMYMLPSPGPPTLATQVSLLAWVLLLAFAIQFYYAAQSDLKFPTFLSQSLEC